MQLLLSSATLNSMLPLLAIIAGVFVITTKNAIISVFNLIVLYILVSFYLIYIGVTYLGISYIIIYIGAIAILFLFIIMMIDIEVVEKRSNNYLPLLFLFLCGFLFTLKKILHNIGLIKMKSLSFREEKVIIKESKLDLYNIVESINIPKTNYINNNNSNIDNNSKNSHDGNNNEGNINYENGEGTFEYNIFNSEKNYYINIIDSKFTNTVNYVVNSDNHYLLISTNWDSVVNRITQITAIGDVLYTVYHSYIYIVSAILLLGMVGAIILTGDSYQQVRILNISRHKKSSLFSYYYLIYMIYKFKLILKKMWFFIKYNYLYNYMHKMICFFFKNVIFIKNDNYYKNIFKIIYIKKSRDGMLNVVRDKLGQKFLCLSSYFHNLQSDHGYSERIIGNLSDFIIAVLLVAFLLLSINSYLSLSIKYLDKGGGFECGFTSFLQTRERYNIYFYRVSLLFLVFDLEIVLAFPYTAVYQKNQNMSKNNVLAFLFILIVGFIFELKEGALNIVKKAHSTEINIKN